MNFGNCGMCGSWNYCWKYRFARFCQGLHMTQNSQGPRCHLQSPLCYICSDSPAFIWCFSENMAFCHPCFSRFASCVQDDHGLQVVQFSFHTACEPTGRGAALLQPAGRGAALLQPAGRGAALLQPAGRGAALLQPAGRGAALLQPAGRGAALLQPAGRGAALLQPAGREAALLQPAGRGAALQPAGGGAVVQPAGGGAALQPAGGGAALQPADGGAALQPAGQEHDDGGDGAGRRVRARITDPVLELRLSPPSPS